MEFIVATIEILTNQKRLKPTALDTANHLNQLFPILLLKKNANPNKYLILECTLQVTFFLAVAFCLEDVDPRGNPVRSYLIRVWWNIKSSNIQIWVNS